MDEQQPIDLNKPATAKDFADLAKNSGAFENALKSLKSAQDIPTDPNTDPDGSASESRDSLIAAYGVPGEDDPDYETKKAENVKGTPEPETNDHIAAAAESGDFSGLTEEDARVAVMLRNAAEEQGVTPTQIHEELADTNPIDLREIPRDPAA